MKEIQLSYVSPIDNVVGTFDTKEKYIATAVIQSYPKELRFLVDEMDALWIYSYLCHNSTIEKEVE
jgi:hypothetical protein